MAQNYSMCCTYKSEKGDCDCLTRCVGRSYGSLGKFLFIFVNRRSLYGVRMVHKTHKRRTRFRCLFIEREWAYLRRRCVNLSKSEIPDKILYEKSF